MDRRNPLAEIVGDVANRVELSMLGLSARIEMSELGNRAAAENADPQLPVDGAHVATG